MTYLSPEYLNSLSSQIIFISSLLCGFSLTVVVTLLNNTDPRPLFNKLLIAAILAALSYLISLFAMTDILLKTTPGFPFEVSASQLKHKQTIGALAFMIGLISILTVIGLAGWTKSNKLGIFTSLISVFTFVFIIYIMN